MEDFLDITRPSQVAWCLCVWLAAGTNLANALTLCSIENNEGAIIVLHKGFYEWHPTIMTADGGGMAIWVNRCPQVQKRVKKHPKSDFWYNQGVVEHFESEWRAACKEMTELNLPPNGEAHWTVIRGERSYVFDDGTIYNRSNCKAKIITDWFPSLK